jgi:hypothetical protein
MASEPIYTIARRLRGWTVLVQISNAAPRLTIRVNGECDLDGVEHIMSLEQATTAMAISQAIGLGEAENG